MEQIKAIKVPLESEEKELYILDGQSKICNWLYNYLLEKANQYKDLFGSWDNNASMSPEKVSFNMGKIHPKNVLAVI